ncbi:RNA polymerase II-associated protein 3-like isoform X2 [Malaya genurostris]|nr:RNA polymerase II-associated protein 3-like isoform X2 [Malaya genurostris]XP_058459078.1 RNA polymerase II-associated protein 3-like isoform X2 [Malaya genurostris]XP_058459079.1 RNA polymerase II-associated protein 3-like isoform X2 [Malaya genurostris]
MTKFSEKMFNIEKDKNVSVSKFDECLKEAERYNDKGNEFCKRAKAGEYKDNNDLTAIDMYTTSIQLNSKNPTSYVNRALCYFNLERYEECIADCKRALTLDKTNIEALYRRMQAYEYLGQNRLAILDCQEILKVSKDSKELSKVNHDMERITKRIRHEADTFKQQGNDHLKNKNYEKAIEYFSEAINLFGSDEVYHYNRSMCYFHLKSYDKCLEDCNKAIETNENYFRPYYQRMRVREIRGEYLAAINDCKKFLDLVQDEKQRSTAYKDLQRLLKIQSEPALCDWNVLRKDASLINFTQKPPHLRSKKPLKRISISEEHSIANSKSNPPNYIVASDYEPIPDAVIDKMFNNNTGERVEEPMEDTNLENLFPSSSKSNRLKRLFSPATTPTTPPKDLFPSFASVPNVVPIGGCEHSQSSEAASKEPINSQTVKVVTDSNMEENMHHTKREKDIINQGNCQPEAEIRPDKVRTTIKYENDNPYPVMPHSSVHFYNIWINLRTENEKYKYLKRLENAPLHKLLGAELSPEMLTEILSVLERYSKEENYSPLRILTSILKHSGIGLLMTMITDKDRRCLIKLLQLMDTIEVDTDAVRDVKKCLTLEV